MDIPDRRENYASNPSDLADLIVAEFDYLSERRKTLGLDHAPVARERADLLEKLKTATNAATVRPSGDCGLFGLALSGGGIRSATFNLGLLQALARCDLLKHVDYLSTVSGGGYIGCCLTSLLHPDLPKQDRGRLAACLRKKFLSRRSGKTKTVKSASVEADDFPFRFGADEQGDERPELKHLRNHGTYLIPDRQLLRRDSWRLVGMYLTGLVTTNYVLMAGLLLAAMIAAWLGAPAGPRPAHLFYRAAAGLALLAVLVRTAATGLNLDFEWRKMRGRVIGFLARLAVGIAVIGGLLHLAALLEQSPEITENLFGERGAGKVAITVLNALVGGSLGGLLLGRIPARSKSVKRMLDGIFRVAWVALIPLLLLWIVFRLAAQDWLLGGPLGPIPAAVVVVFFVALGLWVNPNRSSMHHFYRDRLSEAFIIRCMDDETVEQNEELDLAELYPAGGGSGAPYHIINTTLNVPSTKHPDLRGRGSDLFIYSGFYCGSQATGYQRMDLYQEGEGRLATAMAISGAALSPQMGRRTGPVISFLLTLLNLRLNRWAPNPRYGAYRRRLRAWAYYMVKELFSRGDEDDEMLNLSDGGHFDNLGLYALLQRRCKYIIVSDVGRDPSFKLGDLCEIIRGARVDLGVDIHMHLEGLTRGSQGCTLLHHAIGEIEYPDGSDGTLIYIKSTRTGKEPLDVADYSRTNPAFPDESTGDQFFREPQFESYRKLGDLSGKEVVGAARREREKAFVKGRLVGSIHDFFTAVAESY